MRLIPPSAAVLLAVIALAGCSSADYPAKADSVCKSYNTKINAIPRPTTAAQLPSYISQVTGVFQQAIAQLKSVKPSSDKKASYDRYVSTLQQEVTALTQAASAAKKDPRQAITVLAAAQALSAQGKSAAQGADLKQCAK